MHAFVPSGLAVSVRPGAFTAQKCSVNARPVARRSSAPKMIDENTLATIPSLPLAGNMEVTFPAYLAIFLGVLIPCAFLIILFIQDQSRKAGEKAGSKSD